MKKSEEIINCYDNRELSWLKFNERVLEEASDEKVPLGERLSFSAIYQSNLDEFFMVRVGSLYDQSLLMHEERENKTNMTSEEQINAILARVREMDMEKDIIYEKNMLELESFGFKLINFQNLTNDEQKYLEKYFEEEIEPLLSAMIVGRSQPFPFLKNKEIYAVALLRSSKGKEKVGIIECSHSVFQRLIEIPMHKGYFMLSEELILHFINRVFKNYSIISKSLIRVTRNADIDAASLYDEDLNYRDLMVELIKRRRKLAPVRIEFSRQLDVRAMENLIKNLGLKKKQCFVTRSPLDMSFLFEVRDKIRNHTEIFFEKQRPQPSVLINEEEKMMPQIKEKDILLSYPYESIKPFIQLLNEAAVDKEVVSIKMTLYRVAKQSKIVEALVEAAERGKEVIVLVELRARFDEENNIEWSRKLEEAGCKVIYGLEGYKVHTKLCLITKKTGDTIDYISQIGTGNYNEKTAGIYTDLSLMTNNYDIGTEVNNIFKALLLGEVMDETQHLLVAPNCFQNNIIKHIDEEIEAAKSGQESYIGLKINSLTDKRIMDKLIEASQAGVKIDMVVRGICCLISGIAGYTENIHVVSIVGRFLEHSRIYIFGKGERERIYIGSADFMTRNTVRRVEAAVPIYDECLKLRISEMFITMLSDNRKARIQKSDGSYKRAENGDTELNSQEYFYKQAYEAYQQERI